MTEQYLKIPVILFKLKISAVERYILALTISFGGECRASNQTLADTFCVSRQAIIDAVNKLRSRGYIDHKLTKNGRFISLTSKETLLLQAQETSQETLPASKETLPEVVKKLGASGQETLPNSISIVNTDSKHITEDYRLAKYLLEKILSRKPDFKKPKLETWAKCIEKMIRIDERKPDVIEAVIDWAQADSFWQDNILSTNSLREQFDKLELRMQKDAHGKTTSAGTGKRKGFSDQKSERTDYDIDD